MGSGCSGAIAAGTLVDAGVRVTMLDVGHRDERYARAIPARDFVSIRREESGQNRYLIGDEAEGVVFGEVGRGRAHHAAAAPHHARRRPAHPARLRDLPAVREPGLRRARHRVGPGLLGVLPRRAARGRPRPRGDARRLPTRRRPHRHQRRPRRRGRVHGRRPPQPRATHADGPQSPPAAARLRAPPRDPSAPGVRARPRAPGAADRGPPGARALRVPRHGLLLGRRPQRLASVDRGRRAARAQCPALCRRPAGASV